MDADAARILVMEGLDRFYAAESDLEHEVHERAHAAAFTRHLIDALEAVQPAGGPRWSV